MSPPAPPPRDNRKHTEVVRATFAFTASKPEELTIAEGDVLYVVSKEDPHWWLCRTAGLQGYVPSNYVGENTAQITNPLHDAAKRGNVSFAGELLANSVNPNHLDVAGNAPIHWAARGGHALIVKMLIDSNASLTCQNRLGDTPLHMAAAGTAALIIGGHDNVIRLLLDKQVSVNIKNSDGKTAFDLATSSEAAALIMPHTFIDNSATLLGGEEEE